MPAPSRHADPETEAAQHPFLAGALGVSFVCSPADEAEQRQLQATYYGMMAEVDDSLGRLFDWLRVSGMWDDTLIIVTSDHGEQMGEHWLVGKLGWFDGSYHIPLIIRDPRADADRGRGQAVSAFTENVDLMPTILDWLGVDELPVVCDGRSLLPFLEGSEPVEWRQAAHWEFDFRIPQLDQHPLGLRMDQCTLSVLRTADSKYVHLPALPPVFYDLSDDPGELHDRSQEPNYREAVLAAAQQMLSWRMENTDRGLSGMVLGPGGVFEGRDRLR